MDKSDLIRKYRKESGMTQEEVAKKIGVSKQTVQRYESGEISNIPSDKIEIMAKCFEITPWRLLGWEDLQQNKSYIEGCEDATLIKKYSHLSDSNKKAVLNLIDNLLSAQPK